MLEIININSENIWSCLSAIGTLLAVIVALFMHFHSEYKKNKKEKENHIEKILSALKGIKAELKSYEIGLYYITKTALDMESVYDKNRNIDVGQNLTLLGESKPNFVFYVNNISTIGLIKNDELLSEIVGFFSYIEMFFDTYRGYREKANIIDKIRLTRDSDVNYKINTLKDVFRSLDGLILEFKDRTKELQPRCIALLESLDKEIAIQEVKLKELR